MLKLFEERDELRIVDDQIGGPTWCRWLAETTSRVLSVYERDAEGAMRDFNGIYHATASGETSWFGFASAIRDARYAGQTKSGPRLVPIGTQEYPLPAKRPANSVLSNAKLQARFGVRPASWREQLSACMASMSPEGRS
jgi:dTDP-4-dehydrorhamnose reductase